MEQPLPQSDDDDLGSPLTQGNPFSPLATGSPAAAAGGAAASSSMSPMESQLFQMMNRMSEIAAASTAAANAAALAAQVAASTTSGGGGRGSATLESRDLLKILPRPDAFKVDRLEDEYSRWISWWWSTRQYLCAIDPQFDVEIKEVEQNMHREVHITDPHVQARSFQLYAILCSLIKGRAFQLVKQVDHQRGYEALRMLLLQFQPPSKVRSLGILSALTQIKGFNAKEPFLPQILELERGFEQYELAAGEAVQSSLKSALLLRSLSGVVRQHISAVLPEDASYLILREAILKYERTQFRWGMQNVFAQDSVLLNSNSQTPQGSGSHGPIPMEIDAVNFKGQGKGGYKAGGKKGFKGASKGGKPTGKSPQYQQQQQPFQQWRQAPPQGGGKGKDKGKGKGGKQRETRQCHVCGKTGHLARDCWQNKNGKGSGGRVQNIQHEPNAIANATAAMQQQQQTLTQVSNNAAAHNAMQANKSVMRVQAVSQVFDSTSSSDVFAGGHVNAVSCCSCCSGPPELATSQTIQIPTGTTFVCSSERSGDTRTAVSTDMSVQRASSSVPVNSNNQSSLENSVDASARVTPAEASVHANSVGESVRESSVDASVHVISMQPSEPEIFSTGQQVTGLQQWPSRVGYIQDDPDPTGMSNAISLRGAIQAISCVSSCKWYSRDCTDQDDNWTYSPELECKGVVCAVQTLKPHTHEVETDVILDSGADWSCLPLEYANHGTNQDGLHDLGLSDAQGNTLSVDGLREVEFLLYTDDGYPVIWKETCAIAPVTQPLLCKGKLMKAGWWEHRDPQMCMQHDSGSRVPMFFKGNSLCVKATIYRIHERQRSSGLQIRFVKGNPEPELVNTTFGWQMAETGHLYYRGRGCHFVDPSIVAPVSWPCRTTLVKPCKDGFDDWLVLEHCVKWGDLLDLTADLPHGESEIICILSSTVEAVEDMPIGLPASRHGCTSMEWPRCSWK